jgi:hypothetical protein
VFLSAQKSADAPRLPKIWMKPDVRVVDFLKVVETDEASPAIPKPL